MSPVTTGIVGIVLLLVLFLMRMPVAFAMTFIGLTGFAYLTGPEPALGLLAQDIFETFSSYPLSVIPMFILMGEILYRSGISERLFRALVPWLYRLPGGLLLMNIISCTLFAAVSGSSAATTATVGRITLAEFEALLTATVEETWRWPTVKDACLANYGTEYCYLTEAGPVTIEVYNVAGRVVRTLLDTEVEAGSSGYVVWDGADDAGDRRRPLRRPRLRHGSHHGDRKEAQSGRDRRCLPGAWCGIQGQTGRLNRRCRLFQLLSRKKFRRLRRSRRRIR